MWPPWWVGLSIGFPHIGPPLLAPAPLLLRPHALDHRDEGVALGSERRVRTGGLEEPGAARALDDRAEEPRIRHRGGRAHPHPAGLQGPLHVDPGDLVAVGFEGLGRGLARALHLPYPAVDVGVDRP